MRLLVIVIYLVTALVTVAFLLFGVISFFSTITLYSTVCLLILLAIRFLPQSKVSLGLKLNLRLTAISLLLALCVADLALRYIIKPAAYLDHNENNGGWCYSSYPLRIKFRFITKNYFQRPTNAEETNLLDITQLQSDNISEHKLYQSGEELLNDVLKNKQYKHQKQLEYLANRHERTILKLRFILSPFSFLFLLKGKEQYHIVMETLDTEEATYIWHFEKEKNVLVSKLKQIDQDLNTIRNHGRQLFLENLPENFHRIVHNYSDERKGFILWKDILEEHLN